MIYVLLLTQKNLEVLCRNQDLLSYQVQRKEHTVPTLKALQHLTGLSVQTFNTSLSMNETWHYTPLHSVPRSLGGTNQKMRRRTKKRYASPLFETPLIRTISRISTQQLNRLE